MCSELIENAKITLDEMYFAVLKLAKDGELIGCDTSIPTVAASDYRYVLVMRDSGMYLLDMDRNGIKVATIPWESQLGGLLCAAVLSSPVHHG